MANDLDQKFLNSEEMAGFRPRVPPQDLTADRLLAGVSMHELLGAPRPCLGGIVLFSKLGRGGKGAVYYGYHSRLNSEVAVKVLLDQEQENEVTRFIREAQAAMRVKSENLVGVLDVNQDTPSGLYFLLMEYVHGYSAGALLGAAKKQNMKGLPEETVLEMMIAASQGLAAAHRRGIIHRDIKPDNILVPWLENGESDYGSAKLADLGLARVERPDDYALTNAGQILGTPGYMAPEQINDAKSAQKPADIFSMGATMYELFSGTRPFTGGSMYVIMNEILNGRHKPLAEMCPALNPRLANLVERCLNKDPAQRFQDGAELQAALISCREEQGAPPTTNLKSTIIDKLTPQDIARYAQSLTDSPHISTPRNREFAPNPLTPGAAVAGGRIPQRTPGAAPLTPQRNVSPQQISPKIQSPVQTPQPRQPQEPTPRPGSLQVSPSGMNARPQQTYPTPQGVAPVQAPQPRQPQEPTPRPGSLQVSQGGMIARPQQTFPVPPVGSLPQPGVLRQMPSRPPQDATPRPVSLQVSQSAPTSRSPQFPAQPSRPLSQQVLPVVSQSRPTTPKSVPVNVVVKKELPPKILLRLSDKVPLDMVLIPPGEFNMGSKLHPDEMPVHQVTFSRPFYLSVTPITQEEWLALMETNPSLCKKGDKYPVEGVKWDDAKIFCGRVQRKNGCVCRLPTEAEWEYACRAGKDSRYYPGDREADLLAAGWCENNSKSSTQPVCRKAPNAFGLYDMLGNVLEWCEDVYAPYNPAPAVNPLITSGGVRRVARGGCWSSKPDRCCTTSRAKYDPGFTGGQYMSLGFRLAVIP